MNQEKLNREKTIKIRVTENELSELHKRSRKPRLAEWMREHCLGVKPSRTAQIPPVDPALLRQLAGIGNNLNQIARSVNSKYSPIESVEVIARLTDIKRALNEIREGESHHDC